MPSHNNQPFSSRPRARRAPIGAALVMATSLGSFGAIAPTTAGAEIVTCSTNVPGPTAGDVAALHRQKCGVRMEFS